MNQRLDTRHEPAGERLDDAAWRRIAPLLPAPNTVGRPRNRDLREILAALRFKVREGCPWRALPPPPRFPAWQTVYGYQRKLIEAGLWPTVRQHLLEDTPTPREPPIPAGSEVAPLLAQAAMTVRLIRMRVETAMAYGAEAELSLAARKKFNASAAVRLDQKRQWRHGRNGDD